MVFMGILIKYKLQVSNYELLHYLKKKCGNHTVFAHHILLLLWTQYLFFCFFERPFSKTTIIITHPQITAKKS